MTKDEREALIDQLDRSFTALPGFVKACVKHALAAPSHHPETGQPFTSFREVIEAASDETLETLRSDFEDNGDLLPMVPRQ